MRFLRYLILVPFFAGCVGKEGAKTNEKHYFDLHAFADAEAVRLTKRNTSIVKTVSQNDQTETKTLKPGDWQSELQPIIESDINKAAFKDSYTSIQKGNIFSYVAKDPKLKTRKIQISLDQNSKVKSLSITNQVDNFLYTSKEVLNYIPDSVYTIERRQNIFILGLSTFDISLKFTK